MLVRHPSFLWVNCCWKFLKLLGISQYRLAKEIDVPAQDDRMQLDDN